MENRAHALAAGLFTLIFALTAAASVWWLSGNREPMQDVVLVAKGSVEGLSAQGQVRFRGYKVGKVLSVTIEPEAPHRILVTTRISRSVPLTTATLAKLSTMGVTGLAYVQLDENKGGQPLPATPGLPRLEMEPSNVAAFSNSATELAGQLVRLTAKLNELFDEKNVGNLGASLGHLHEALEQTSPLLADMRRVLSEENVKNLHVSLTNLAQASGEAAPLAAQAKKTLASLDALSVRLESLAGEAGGEITASSLPRLNRAMQEVSSSSRQLSRVLNQIERSPQSLLFGSLPPAPGPGEPGFSVEK